MDPLNAPFYKAVFNQAFQFAVLLDTRGVVLEMNQLCREVCGPHAENVQGRPFREAAWWRDFPQSVQATDSAMAKVLKDTIVQDEVIFLDRKNRRCVGTRIFSPIKNEAGDITLISVVGLDVTEQRKAEAALAQSEAQYKNLVNNIPGTTFRFVKTLREEFRFDFIGENCAAIFGYAAKEIMDNPQLAFERIPHPDIEAVILAIHESAATLAPYRVEHRAVKKDGTTAWFFTSSIPSRLANGDIAWDGIAIDITDQKQDKAMLTRTQAFNQTLLESSPILFLIHQDGVIKYMNQFGARILGSPSPGNFLGRNIFELVQPADHPIIIRRLEKIKAGMKNPPEDIGLLGKGNRVVYVESTSLPIQYEDAPCSLLMGIDVTERKRSEQALAKSEKRWQHILIHIPQIGISLDPEGRILFANEYFLRLTGWKREEVLGKDWFGMFIPGPIRQEIQHVFRTTMGQKSTNGMSTYENDIVTKNGSIRNISWSNVLTADAKGNIRDVTCLGVDLTERILAEQALKESEAKYRSMMESMDEAAYICSPAFIIEYMNPAMVRRMGRDATGETCHRAIHKNPEKCPWCQHARIMKGETVKTELVMDGSGETYLISHSPIFHTNGSVSKLSIYRDVTEIKRLEERLQQSQKMESIGTLAGGIAHDFNNILFPIIGLAEILMEDLPQGSTESESATEILKAGKRGRDLVSQILSFSRQSDRKRMPIQIQRVLKEVLQLSRATLPSSIEIAADIQKDCGLVMGESTQMHQVLMNLITNAFHAVETRNGSIVVELKETFQGPDGQIRSFMDSPGFARLTVKDNGIGIPQELMGKIFDPYFTTKAKGKGTGLGLATVYGIVKEFDGEIRVSSKEGEGTAFTLYFPLLAQATEKEFSPDIDDSLTGNERILVVDDEEAVAALEKKMLERSGYQVTQRSSSMDALEKFKADPGFFDLVITDMTMPNMTGDRLAEAILNLRPDIPIILCTGFSEQMNRLRAKNIGIRGFLNKPIVRAELTRMVRTLLDEPG